MSKSVRSCCQPHGLQPTCTALQSPSVVNVCVRYQPKLRHACIVRQAITVGQQEFGFTANKEGTCDVVHLPPPDSGLPAMEVARLHQRLHVQVRPWSCTGLIAVSPFVGHCSVQL